MRHGLSPERSSRPGGGAVLFRRADTRGAVARDATPHERARGPAHERVRGRVVTHGRSRSRVCTHGRAGFGGGWPSPTAEEGGSRRARLALQVDDRARPPHATRGAGHGGAVQSRRYRAIEDERVRCCCCASRFPTSERDSRPTSTWSSPRSGGVTRSPRWKAGGYRAAPGRPFMHPHELPFLHPDRVAPVELTPASEVRAIDAVLPVEIAVVSGATGHRRRDPVLVARGHGPTRAQHRAHPTAGPQLLGPGRAAAATAHLRAAPSPPRLRTSTGQGSKKRFARAARSARTTSISHRPIVVRRSRENTARMRDARSRTRANCGPLARRGGGPVSNGIRNVRCPRPESTSTRCTTIEVDAARSSRHARNTCVAHLGRDLGREGIATSLSRPVR